MESAKNCCTLEIFYRALRGEWISVIDCQVKCNTIREKIFEAPRRESGN